MLEKLFQLEAHGSTVRKELLAAVTTFLTMSYIIVVNPSILKETGMPFEAVLTATIVVSFLSSVLMGLFANLPYGLAPGMGVNAFFTFTLVLGFHVPWATALGATFLAGLIFMLVSVFKLRETFVRAMPVSLRYSVAAGIGLFIALIGFSSAGFLVAGKTASDPISNFAGLNTQTVFFIAALVLTSALVVFRVRGAMIIAVAVSTVAAWVVSSIQASTGSPAWAPLPTHVLDWPDFSLFLRMDIGGAFQWGLVWAVFTIAFVDLFDSIPTFVGLAEAGKLIDPRTGEPQNMGRALFVDAIGTTLSGIFGTSSVTTYIESASGIKQGGKTGLTAVLIGLFFLPFLFFSPLLGAVPNVATAPILVLIGVFMLAPLAQIPWDDFEESIPAFLGLILIPLTGSINLGMTWAFLTWTLFKVFRGKWSAIHPMLWAIDVLCVANLVLSYNHF